MDRAYDLVVVGTGTASGAASRCRGAGWTVAVIDSRPVGGTCALRGCRPKKLLVSAGEAVHTPRDMAGRGILDAGLRIDWPALMRFKRSETDPLPAAFTDGYAKAGIDVIKGRARFVGPATLAVNGDRVTGRHVLIASGARPAPLGVPGEELVASSDRFLDLDTLPSRIVFIGGGFISFEFAHLAARAGADVTILHRGAHPLEGFDPDLVANPLDQDNLLKSSGRGIFLIRNFMDDVQLERTPQGGMEIRMVKRPPPPDQAAPR